MSVKVSGSDGVDQSQVTGSTQIPVGTTAQRPANPEEGMMRFNTDEGQVERYDGISWGSIDLGELLAAVSEAADIDEAVSFIGRGAIVESVSNSNGHYVRWENGEQVCWNESLVGNWSAISGSGTHFIADTPADFVTAFVPTAFSLGQGTVNTPESFNYLILVRNNAWHGRVDNGRDTDVTFSVFSWGFWK